MLTRGRITRGTTVQVRAGWVNIGVDSGRNFCNAVAGGRPQGVSPHLFGPVASTPRRLSAVVTAGGRDLLLCIVEPRAAYTVPTAWPEQEAAVNRLTNRLVAASAGFIACGLILTGCGAGQISRPPTRRPLSTAPRPTSKPSPLRNVHLQATQTSDFLQPGRTVPLMFVAANDSPTSTTSW